MIYFLPYVQFSAHYPYCDSRVCFGRYLLIVYVLAGYGYILAAPAPLSHPNVQ